MNRKDPVKIAAALERHITCLERTRAGLIHGAPRAQQALGIGRSGKFPHLRGMERAVALLNEQAKANPGQKTYPLLPPGPGRTKTTWAGK